MVNHSAEAIEVATPLGRIRGLQSAGVRSWLGIPYAAPATAEHRWRVPQPVEPWTGVRLADRFSDYAPQPQTPIFAAIPGVRSGEDCLSLNIWAPQTAHTQNDLKPVMVWIHGGGFIVGASAQPVYDGATLATTGDVVVVTVNYRLGALGFLDFSFLNGEGAIADNRFESNLGLRDLVAALEWVRDNIASFGGNPNDVTVFGQSAGAACITTLMTMPATRGLFHKAIAQSPPATSVYFPERIQRVSEQYLNLVGNEHGRPEDALLKLPAQALVEPTLALLNQIATNSPGTLAFAPVVDGTLVPEHPIDVFTRGDQHPIPLLIGSTRDEAALFKLMNSPLMPTTSESIEQMFQELKRENPELPWDLQQLTTAYPAFPKQKGAIQISSDAGICMPVTWIAESHANLAPTHVYRFDQATPMLKLTGLGAIHASELAYVFGNIPKIGRPDRRQAIWFGGRRSARKVSDRVRHLWTSFANSNWSHWPQYDRETRETLIIASQNRIESDPNRARRVAWGERAIGFR